MSSTTDVRVALISGASRLSGLGYQTALFLGHLGFIVIPTARTSDGNRLLSQSLNKEGVIAVPVQLDTTDSRDVDRVVKLVENQFGRLDVLVNNAGVNLDQHSPSSGLPSKAPLDHFRSAFETNVLGSINLTQKLLPMLRRSCSGRIVNVSSILGSLNHLSATVSDDLMTQFPSYSVSKTALNAWTVLLAQELSNTHIKVNSAHPGWVRTDMGGQSAPIEVKDGIKTIIQLATLPADGPTGGVLSSFRAAALVSRNMSLLANLP